MAQRHCGEWRAAEARLSLVCDLTLTTPMLRLRGCTWNYMKFVVAIVHTSARGVYAVALARELVVRRLFIFCATRARGFALARHWLYQHTSTPLLRQVSFCLLILESCRKPT